MSFCLYSAPLNGNTADVHLYNFRFGEGSVSYGIEIMSTKNDRDKLKFLARKILCEIYGGKYLLAEKEIAELSKFGGEADYSLYNNTIRGILSYEQSRFQESANYFNDLTVHSASDSLFIGLFFCWKAMLYSDGYAAYAIALESLRMSEKFLSADKQLSLFLAYAHLQFSRIYQNSGNLAGTDLFLKKAQIVFEKCVNCAPELADIQNIKAINFLYVGETQNAQAGFKRAISISTGGRLNKNLGKYYDNLGYVSLKKKDYPAAKEQLSKGLQLNYSIHFGSLKASNSLINLAQYYTEMENYSAAVACFRKCIEIRSVLSTSNSPSIAIAYQHLAVLYEKQGMLDSALITIQSAIRSIDQNHAVRSFSENPKYIPSYFVLSYLSILRDKAGILFKYYKSGKGQLEHLTSAYRTITVVDSVSRVMRYSFEWESSKTYIDSFMRDVYDRGLTYCHELYQLSNNEIYIRKGLKFMESVKYGILQDRLQQMLLRSQEHYSEILTKEDLMNGRILELRLRMESLADTSRAFIDLEKRLLVEQEKLFEFYNSVKNLKTLFRSNTVIDSVLDGRGFRKEVSYLNYFFGDSKLFLIAINPTKNKFTRVDLSDSLNSAIDKTVSFLQDRDVASKTSPTTYQRDANLIFDRLVRPAQIQPGNRIVVIPDGKLSLIPFDILVSSDQLTANYKTMPYLLHQYVFSTAFSLTWLCAGQYRSGRTGNSIIAFGESDGNSELKYLADKFGAQLFTGHLATKVNFFSNAKDANVVHISLHGISDYDRLAGTGILFSKNANDRDTLSLSDMYSMRWSPDLVVLGSCETALGKEVSGEGLFSMARAFAFSHVRSLILSYWKIPDRFTGEILTDFYSENEEQNISFALRNAKLNFLANHDEFLCSPENWAGLTLMGRDFQLKEIVSTNRPYHPNIIFAAIGLLIMIILLIKAMRVANGYGH